MSNGELRFDALLPPEMAEKAALAGVKKANLSTWPLLVLSVLAGAFIALGAVFATIVTTDSAGTLSFGVSRLLGGLVFCLGLVLVVIAGAELFTGNNLIVMAWASGKVSTAGLLRNWALVYAGNFFGSVATAVIVYLSAQYKLAGGAVGLNALNIAQAKVNLGFFQALALGILCNALVCLAVWLTLSARSTTDKILAIIFPITAFVAAGFEHSIANMYFIPIGIFIKSGAPIQFWQDTGAAVERYASLTWQAFIWQNLVPVTIGNIIGGALLVGVVYWFIYLRRRR